MGVIIVNVFMKETFHAQKGLQRGVFNFYYENDNKDDLFSFIEIMVKTNKL
jgi:hypothetical protein